MKMGNKAKKQSEWKRENQSKQRMRTRNTERRKIKTENDRQREAKTGPIKIRVKEKKDLLNFQIERKQIKKK